MVWYILIIAKLCLENLHTPNHTLGKVWLQFTYAKPYSRYSFGWEWSSLLHRQALSLLRISSSSPCFLDFMAHRVIPLLHLFKDMYTFYSNHRCKVDLGSGPQLEMTLPHTQMVTVNHTFSQPGTYPINVTCLNHVSSNWTQVIHKVCI